MLFEAEWKLLWWKKKGVPLFIGLNGVFVKVVLIFNDKRLKCWFFFFHLIFDGECGE